MAAVRVGSRRRGGGLPAAVGSVAEAVRASVPLRAVLLIGCVVVALVVLGTALLVTELRSREISDARRSLDTLSALLAESTARTLESVDLVLQSTLDQLRQEGVTSAESLGRLRSDARTHEMLRVRVAGLPQLAAISIVGQDGRLVSFSRERVAPEIDLSDRDHFRRLRDEAPPEPFLSEPVENRGNGQWSTYLARRILGPDGRFIGIVYAAIELAFFQRSYAALDLGRETSISLWQLNGTLLVRYPDAFAIGRRFGTAAFQDIAQTSPPLIYETPSGIDGQARLVARRVVRDFAAVSVISRTMPSVLADWKRQTTAFVAAGVLVAVAAVAVLAALARQFWAYEEVARAMRDRSAALQGRDELEAQLRQSQKLEAMGQLTSGLAHDFNNLLAVTLGNLERLGRNLPEDRPDLRRALDGARGGAERAAGLTQRLLAFSRRQPVAPSSLDVNAIVDGMQDLLRQTLGANMVLRLDLAPALAPTFADPNGLESALLNLVVNARDAMPGGGTVTVETRGPDETTPPGSGEPGPFLRVTVADTGEGMSPETAQRAFEPFFTTKEPGLGTGLGLAQVYGFARQSNGACAIETREGAGTRVTLSLPATPIPVDRTLESAA